MSNQDPSDTTLGPVIARLKEIQRKCDAMGSRSEEFPRVKERISSIISRLETGQEPSGEALNYRALARELFPVAHVFESVGFMSIGKEIAYLERTLSDLGPGTGDEEGPDYTTARISARPGDDFESPGDHLLDRKIDNGVQDKQPVPMPVVVGLVVLIVAAAAAVAIVTGVGPFDRSPVVEDPPPTATPVPPTPTPPPPTPTAAAIDSEPSDAARLTDAVAKARLAILKGDVERAGTQLAEAALIDHTDEDVVEIAQQLVDIFVQDSNRAAYAAQWESAEDLLERARRTAMRFGLETTAIDNAASNHAQMERFVVIGPDQTGAIRANTGRRVEVSLRDGGFRSGTIGGLSGSVLLLDVAKDVGGGGLFHYTDELPLSEIQTIKIYEE
jgi:hypothetical protein